MDGLLAIGFLIGGVLLYFMPWLVAANRQHHAVVGIFVLNILFGWTLIGWVAALIWSYSGNAQIQQPQTIALSGNGIAQQNPLPSTSKKPWLTVAVGVIAYTLATIAAVAAVLIVVGLWGYSRQQNPAADGQPQASVAAEHAPIANTAPEPEAIAAIDLWREYEANEVAADTKFKGRLLLVSGMVASIDKDFLDHSIIRLRTGNEFESVAAELKYSEVSKAAATRKGTEIAVRCLGGGKIVGSPRLQDCTIE